MAEKIILKNDEQIEGIRRSCSLAADTLIFARQLVQPGVNTEYIDHQLELFMRDNGAIPATLGYQGYGKSSCISLNDVVCHGIPGKETLQEGDILNIDVTTVLDGYYGDNSAMFTVGNVSPGAQQLMEFTLQALYHGIEQCRPGNRFGNIGYEIQRLANREGYGVVEDYGGHGVGLQFHEEPYVLHTAKKNSGQKMKPGMIFTIEPMINQGRAGTKVDNDKWTARTVDGGLSAQYEHTVLVTQDGYDILTQKEGSH